MTLDNIQDYVENQLDVYLKPTSRKRRTVYCRTIFFELAYRYGKDGNGKHLSVEKIAAHLDKHHTSVLHHRKNIFPTLENLEPEIYRVYTNFKNIRHNDSDEDIKEKYRILMSDYLILLANFDKLKDKNTNTNSDLINLIQTINEDKVGLFIERAKPMIKMINKSKFYKTTLA